MCTDTQLAKAHLLANLTLSQQARVAQSVERTTLIVWSWVRASAQTILKYTLYLVYVYSTQARLALLYCSASTGKLSPIAQSQYVLHFCL
eukprot:1149-Heterococcus_DN1.PRE.1